MTLTELKELARAATPGPWTSDDGAVIVSDGFGFSSVPAQYWPGDVDNPAPGDSDNDADFIAAARNHLDELIERVEKLGEALSDIREKHPRCDCMDAPAIAKEALSLYGPDKELG